MVGLIKICVNMDEEKQRKIGENEEKNEGERQGKKKKKERKRKSTDIGSVCGAHK